MTTKPPLLGAKIPPLNAARPAQAHNADQDEKRFWYKTGAGFLGTLALLVVMGVMNYRAQVNEQDAGKLVTLSHLIENDLQKILIHKVRAESNVRGFLLNGNPEYLRTYAAESRSVTFGLSRLRGLILDAAQLRRLSEWEPLLNAHFASLDEQVSNRRAGQPVTQEQLAQGSALSEKARALAESMLKEQSALLAQHTANADRQGNLATIIMVGGSVVGVAVTLWLYAIIIMQVRRRRATEDALRASDALQRAVLASVGHAVVTTTVDGTITNINRAAQQLLGFPAEELVGKMTPCLFHDPAEIATRAAELTRELGVAINPDFEVLAANARQNLPDDHEWTYICRDGSRFPVRLSMSAIRDSEDQFTGYVAIATDITVQKQQLKALDDARYDAEQAALAKAAFLATMSHEIRTPMNGVIGMTSLLLDTSLTDEQREFAQVIRESGEGLLVVINDILDYSKIESGKMEMERVAFGLNDAVESSIDVLAEKSRAQKIDLVYLIDDNVPPWVYGDLQRLRQVLVNLISNAVKFTQQGDVFISVQRAADAGDTPVIKFSVQDSGIGMTPEVLGRLFSAFTQADSSTSRKYGGTGLGLAISKRLVEAMGGVIGAESVPGAGSTFYFTLPAPPAPAPAQETAARDSAPSLKGRRVLVVDDNPNNLRVLALQVERWGLQPRATPMPREALAWITAGEPFDLVITDLHMPEMDGVELARELRRARPTLPILMLSSLDMRHFNEPDLFAALLKKPVRQATLVSAMERALSATAPLSASAGRGAASAFDPELGTRLPLRILLAEDNAVNRLLALKVLKAFGHTADVAANGLEAVAAVKQQPYDLVLMDVQMPEMDGLDATRTICDTLPAQKRPYIYAISANAMREDVDAALAAGMDGYLTKPIVVSELRVVLEQCGAAAAKKKAQASR